MKKRQTAHERMISNKRISALKRKIDLVLKSEGYLAAKVSEIEEIINRLESDGSGNKTIQVRMHNNRKSVVQSNLRATTLRREKMEKLLIDYLNKNDSIYDRRYGSPSSSSVIVPRG